MDEQMKRLDADLGALRDRYDEARDLVTALRNAQGRLERLTEAKMIEQAASMTDQLVKKYGATLDAGKRLRDSLQQLRRPSGVDSTGVPNGWAGRKDEIAIHRENAQSDAERIMERLEDERAFVPDCREARIAMTAPDRHYRGPRHAATVRGSPLPRANMAQQRLRLGDLWHFGRHRKGFEHRAQDCMRIN
jgi:hypothetical protein